MTRSTDLGLSLGSYQSESIPFWVTLAMHLPWVKTKVARRAVSEIRVFEHGIQLLRNGSGKDTTLHYTEIRRVWFERFTTGSEQPGHTAFRIDLIAQNLDTLFRLTKVDCTPDDQDLVLMERLYETWRQENWRHYHVVAAVITTTAQTAGRSDLTPDTPVYLCMQKGDTRYSYTSRHWEFPGGKVEEGETEPEALHRELLEEMDYDVTVGSHLTTVKHRYRDFSLSLACYLCHASTATFTRKEHIAHQWLTPEEMSHLEWCEADAVAIQDLQL